MKSIPVVGDFMTPYPYMVEASESIEHAQRILRENKIRHLPVVRDGKPFSVVTEREINLVFAQCADVLTPEHMKVENFCAQQTYIVEMSEPLVMVLTEMASRHIGSAIVVKDGRLAGIFTSTDACRCFAEYLKRDTQET